jgi:hypothetical protein
MTYANKFRQDRKERVVDLSTLDDLSTPFSPPSSPPSVLTARYDDIVEIEEETMNYEDDFE